MLHLSVGHCMDDGWEMGQFATADWLGGNSCEYGSDGEVEGGTPCGCGGGWLSLGSGVWLLELGVWVQQWLKGKG